VVRLELKEVRRHKDTMADQIQMMQQGRGVACYSKPCLHPNLLEEIGGAFKLEPCFFLNQWYTSFDVVLVTCKHFITHFASPRS
jgi:hypothetical protein